ncbi:PH domain-containing protein [Methanocaldococcus sp. 28A]
MSYKVPSGLELLPGENVLWYSRICWKSLIGWLILGALTILIYGLALIFIGIALLKRYYTEYAITNKRVYCRYGILSRKTVESTLDKITNTSISQGILGRLLNYGDLRINTAGSTPYEIVFEGVSNPKYVQSKIRSVADAYQKNNYQKNNNQKSINISVSVNVK